MYIFLHAQVAAEKDRDAVVSLCKCNCDILIESGYTKPITRIGIKEVQAVSQTVVLHQVILHSLGEPSHFRDGIEAVQAIASHINSDSHLTAGSYCR